MAREEVKPLSGNIDFYEDEEGRYIFRREEDRAIVDRHLGDKVNFAYIIQRQLVIIQQAELVGYDTFVLAVNGLLNLIPSSEVDERFKKDLQNCKVLVEVGTGVYSHEMRIMTGTMEIKEKRWLWDPYATLRACIDLLRRRGLLLVEKERQVFF